MIYLAPSDYSELFGSYAPSEYTHMLIHRFVAGVCDIPSTFIMKRAKNERFIPIHQIKGIKGETLYQEIFKSYCFDHCGGHHLCRKHVVYDIFYFRIVPREEVISAKRNDSDQFECSLNGLNWYNFSPDEFILQIGYIDNSDTFGYALMHGEKAKTLYLKLTGCDEASTNLKQDDLHQMDWFDIA